MSIFVFKNNASSLLASGISNSDTTCTVQAGQGALFPAISAGQQAAITLEDVSGDIEVVYATGRTGDTLTIVRAQEGTSAIAFASGSRVEQRVTAGVLNALLQKQGGDTLSGTTVLSGVLNLGSGGSIQGGEIAGVAIRSAPGDTSNQILVPVGGGAATEGGSPILTKANLAANLPAGHDLVVTQMIVMWAGSSGSIPAGWHLCDGTNGTPDLRDLFIVGGGGSFPTSGVFASTTGATSPGTPVINPVTLGSTNLPAHHHGNVIWCGNAGQIVGPTGTVSGGFAFQGFAGAGVAVNWNTADTGTSTAFTPTAAAMGTHTHSVAAPPYRAVFAIMKL